MPEGASPGLERSCGSAAGDWLRTAPPSPGLERIEACFAGPAFAPHRHDTYAVGFTMQGVQSFRYRGAAQHSLPGEVFVLHPDELHDGHGEAGVGFRYRILYVEPRLIAAALGDGSAQLPFVGAAVSRDARVLAAIMPALGAFETPLEYLRHDQVVLELAEALAAISGELRSAPPARHRRAVAQARECLDADPAQPVTSAALEAATGLSRYELARQFRACLGTSPYRYWMMRRLDRARGLIRDGRPLADVAVSCGFADQSHMTRQFKRAFGLSPGRWAALSA